MKSVSEMRRWFVWVLALVMLRLALANPLFEGWYADPQVRRFGDRYWIYPTYSQDFKEQTFMDAFSSKDLMTWTKHPQILTAESV